MPKYSDEALLGWLEKKAQAPEDIASRVIAIFSEPGVGKTVLACKLGQRVCLITNEKQGSASLSNPEHGDLKKNVRVVPFRDWDFTAQIIPLIEDGKFCHTDGQPFDVIVLDTISGMLMDELDAIVSSGITPKTGRLTNETASQPDYLVSRDRLVPVMKAISNLTRCTVVLLSHTRLGDKLTPGASTRMEGHASAFQLINKYVSVMAYLKMDKDGNRNLQVMPTGNGLSVKTRYHFPSVVVSDDDFVAHIAKWKEQ